MPETFKVERKDELNEILSYFCEILQRFCKILEIVLLAVQSLQLVANQVNKEVRVCLTMMVSPYTKNFLQISLTYIKNVSPAKH